MQWSLKAWSKKRPHSITAPAQTRAGHVHLEVAADPTLGPPPLHRVDCAKSYALENAHSILRESKTVVPIEDSHRRMTDYWGYQMMHRYLVTLLVTALTIGLPVYASNIEQAEQLILAEQYSEALELIFPLAKSLICGADSW